MKTAAHFRRVEDQMAKDRAHADFALKTATTRFSASMNAFKALNTKRFAKTVKSINAARAEAKARVKKAKGEFNMKIRLLRATVKQQKARTLARINTLSGVVAKHKLDQARVNANVAAETKRMIKIGQQRYDEHLKKDKELKALVKSNQAANAKRLGAMSKAYMAQLDSVENTMKKNRAHATRRLAQETSKLYAAISKSEKAQMKVNGNLAVPVWTLPRASAKPRTTSPPGPPSCTPSSFTTTGSSRRSWTSSPALSVLTPSRTSVAVKPLPPSRRPIRKCSLLLCKLPSARVRSACRLPRTSWSR